MKWSIPMLLLLLPLCLPEGKAQDIAVKTNLAWNALATVSGGMEFGLSPRWTLDVSGNYNNWTRSHGRRWKHWVIQPEARYWTCERFGGHFFGIHLHGGRYNIGNLKNDVSLLGTDFSKISHERYQGWFAGGGLGYGYCLILGRHWNLEAEVGIGYSYTRYDRYPCAWCGVKTASDEEHHYFGPTKMAINLVYLF